ncbi:MAG: hypothetical protein JWN41_585 [Thermoleophilia bacterium]|nr:hypothetical protein [Thermoleophilia bacterium]
MNRILVFAACCVAALSAPASALADPSPELQIAGRLSWADQVSYSSINVPVSCDVGAEPAATDRCIGEVSVSAASANPNTGQATESPTAVASLTVDMAVGESRVVSVATPVTSLRDRLLLTGSHTALVDVRLSTAGQLTGGAQQIAFVFVPPSPCHLPTYVGYSGSPLLYKRASPGVTAAMLRSPVLDLFTQSEVVADRGPMSFKLLGLTYTAAQGTTFLVSCAAVNAVHHGAWMPAITLKSGSIRITGHPVGRQFAATVTTSEGNLGSRRGEAVDLSVVRDAKHRVSMLHVKRGKSGQITPIHTTKGSACTNGSSLRVDRVGHISAA